MKQTIDFQQIRLDHDLFTLIERYLGKPKQGKWLCPFHTEKTPSFTVNGDHFKCFGCGVSGDVTDFVAMMNKMDLKDAAKTLGGYLLDLGLSREETKAKQAEIRAEYQRREQERLAEEQKHRDEALQRIAGMITKVGWYHNQVDQARPYWHAQGLTDGTIDRYHLGYCPQCPTCQDSPSYVIPYFQSWQPPDTHYPTPQLISIRHRLVNPNGSGKYRPEFAGLPNQLFNTDALKFETEEIPFGFLDPGQIILVEGEIKAIYLTDVVGMPAVGAPGANSWQDDWLPIFAHTSLIYVVFDPGAEQQARKVTAAFNSNGLKAVQVTITCKPDDFFVRFGGKVGDFLSILKQGRKVQ